MWKIEITKDNTIDGRLWHNKHGDDFARFIPKQLGEDKSDLEFYQVDPAHVQVMNDLLGESIESLDENNETVYNLKHVADMSASGKIKVKLVSDNSIVYEIAGVKKEWSDMYDEDMKFILK